MPKEQRFRGASHSVDLDQRQQVRTAETNAFMPQGHTATVDAMRRIAASAGEKYQPLVNAFAAWTDAFHRDDMRNIMKENERQKEQGASDAAMGRAAELENDLDYMNVYDRVLAQKNALQDAAEFQALAATWGDDVNAEAMRGEFFKQKMGEGTGRNVYDYFYADNFNRRTEEIVSQHKMAQIKLTYQRGKDNLAQLVAAEAQSGEISVESIRKLEKEATVMHHGDEIAARQFVWTTLSSNSKTPEALHKLSVTIHQKGYGPNGESFAELFPNTAHEISEKATQDYLSGIEADGYEAYRQIEEVFMNPEVIGNKDHFAGAILALEAVRNRYGGDTKYDAIKRDIVEVLKVQADTIAATNRLNMKLGDPSSIQLEKDDVTKFGDQMLASNGITNPQSDPGQASAAGIISAQLGAIPPGLKKTMESAMGNINDPNGIVSAFAFYEALGTNGGDLELTGNARTIYFGLKGIIGSSGLNPEVALQQFLGNEGVRDALTSPSEIKWNLIKGKPDDKNAEVRGEVAAEVRKGFADTMQLGNWYEWSDKGADKVIIDPALEEEIMGSVGAAAITYRNAGIDDAVGTAVEAVTKSGKFIAIPVGGGNYRIERNKMVTEIGGKKVYGPGIHYNQESGQYENTVETFHKEMDSIEKILPGIFPEQDAEGTKIEFSVAKDNDTDATGVFRLRRNGMPFFISAGQEFMYRPGAADDNTPLSLIQWFMPGGGALSPNPSEKVTLSKDPKQAAAQLQGLLPDNFVVIPHEFNGKWGFEVGYRFHMTGDLPTIEKLKENYGK